MEEYNPSNRGGVMKTSGFHHIQISVSDIDRSLAFYTGLMGMEVAFRAGELVFLRTPGADDLLTLRPTDEPVDPEVGGMQHFGFNVADEDFEAALDEVRAFGTEVLSSGRFGGDGTAYAYIKDPDGYTIEL
jgi:catechol 2,3-dioxygenase-like lactoylglutathione lyase family enzyme